MLNGTLYSHFFCFWFHQAIAKDKCSQTGSRELQQVPWRVAVTLPCCSRTYYESVTHRPLVEHMLTLKPAFAFSGVWLPLSRESHSGILMWPPGLPVQVPSSWQKGKNSSTLLKSYYFHCSKNKNEEWTFAFSGLCWMSVATCKTAHYIYPWETKFISGEKKILTLSSEQLSKTEVKRRKLWWIDVLF